MNLGSLEPVLTPLQALRKLDKYLAAESHPQELDEAMDVLWDCVMEGRK